MSDDARRLHDDGVDDCRSIEAALADRFGDPVTVPAEVASNARGLAALATLASRRVHRSYADRPVGRDTVRLLCACALSSASKSDLQQRDIIVVDDPPLRRAIADLVPDSPQVRRAPAFLVFCANGARLHAFAELRGKPFPNDHLDLFFNAVGDAAIALAACMDAAEALGLGTCPISEIRNHAMDIDRLLRLPDRVVPFAGLCIGWPKAAGSISPRLPLAATVHQDRFDDRDLARHLAAYDARREAQLPYERQLDPHRWGTAPSYGWSEHKARQYAVSQRADFGAYVRAKRFRLD